MRIFRSARPVGAHKSLFLHWHAMANGIVVLPVFLPQFDNHLCLSLLHALAYALAHPFLGFCLNYSSAHYIHQPFLVLVPIGDMCDDSIHKTHQIYHFRIGQLLRPAQAKQRIPEII